METPTPAGEEVQPAEGGDDSLPAATPPETTVETPETPETPAADETAEPGKEADPQSNQLPEHLAAELAQWEAAGGPLPPALQKLIERRIGKYKGEVEATKAELEKLRAEAQTKPERTMPHTAMPPEAELQAKVAASKKFLKDARPFVGGYATEEQRARIEKFMAQQGLDENTLRQQMDEVTDWLTTEVPVQMQRVQQFRNEEATFAPIVKSRFPTLDIKGSRESRIAAEVLELLPEMRQRTPANKLALGMHVLGVIAAEHLMAASPDGDVVATLKGLLAKHAPIPTKAANGHTAKPGALPGRAPVRLPTGSPVAASRAPLNGREQQLEQASQELRENPTAENVMNSLRIALR